MANITYNGITGANNLITFTDVPNILKFKGTSTGSKATVTINVVKAFATATTRDNQWYITIAGDTVTNTKTNTNAIGNRFWVTIDRSSTAASIAMALRNCPTVSSLFTVVWNSTTVTLTARSVGKLINKIDNFSDTNIDSEYVTLTVADGGSSSDNYVDNQVFVDVMSDGQYITTLQKNYYGDEAAFNMSPVLTTLAKHGDAVPYNFKIYYQDSLKMYHVETTTSTNYITPGYMVNQGSKFLQLGSGTIVAQNYARGANRDLSNNTLLYVYGNTIPLSFYSPNAGAIYIDVLYLDSARNQIHGVDVTYSDTDPNDKLKDFYIPLNTSYLNDSFYVDVYFEGSHEKIRYNVIKPIKATEYYQRILWRNSYGGISFFDFTGQKSETRDVDLMTYQKNIYGYYDDSKNELEKIYDNDVKYSVTLKSHLFENDGKYVFNDLLQSTDVWTEVNGEKYGIIIDNVSVDELSDRNNIYEATLKYHYSQEPSIL